MNTDIMENLLKYLKKIYTKTVIKYNCGKQF